MEERAVLCSLWDVGDSVDRGRKWALVRLGRRQAKRRKKEENGKQGKGRGGEDFFCKASWMESGWPGLALLRTARLEKSVVRSTEKRNS